MDGKSPVINFEDLAKMTMEEQIKLINRYREDKDVGTERLISLWPITRTWLNSLNYQYNKAIKRGKDPSKMPAILTKEEIDSQYTKAK